MVLSKARENAVPAGASLAVDRDKFAESVTKAVESCSEIKRHPNEVTEIPSEGIVIIATGPLTSKKLSASLASLLGQTSLYFYDAISPIVSAESLDESKMFWASRYDKGDADFLNIPLTKEQYESFVDELLKAEKVLAHDFEEEKYFEACMPIETIASRGPMTLAFGPMKPVGLNDPKTGKRAFAVIQLRTENRYKTAYNLVGFQTKMKYNEQQRIFRMLPGMENAEFLRLGSMHRNTYLNSPQVLSRTLQLKNFPRIFIAGQLTGTEGYLESSATGLLAGINAGRLALGKSLMQLPETTMLGALLNHITDPLRESFQPMNANFGVLPPLDTKIRDKSERHKVCAKRSQTELSDYLLSAGGL
jgi:methylenetetrahydrofolate--tRNA-(uracil-5-)-methyltransferase